MRETWTINYNKTRDTKITWEMPELEEKESTEFSEKIIIILWVAG